jgi:hypothetical protein
MAIAIAKRPSATVTSAEKEKVFKFFKETKGAIFTKKVKKAKENLMKAKLIKAA